MARSLVKYMSDARAIRSAILSEFDYSPSVATIAAHRGQWLKAKALAQRGAIAPSCECRGWDWSGRQHEADMALANDAFLAAICREARP